MLAFSVGFSTFPILENGPLRRVQIGTDLFFFNKLDEDAPID